MFGRVDPARASDLRDRRERYERRARSIRYGTVRAGSLRHLLQTSWLAVAGLRRPGRLLLVIAAVGSACSAAAGLGWRDGRQLLVAVVAVPVVLAVVAVCTWAQETIHARRQPDGPPLVSRPDWPARRARQES